MGWRTDWLYQLIFAEITRLWSRAQRQGTEGRYGPPPEFLRIREYDGADWELPGCLGPVVRAWAYRGTDFAICPLIEDEPKQSRVPGCMFYSRGTVGFHVRPDRR